MADNIELIILFHPVGGEDFSVTTTEFTGEAAAAQAISQALDDRRSLVFVRARYNRGAAEDGVVINLANIVSVRVSTTDSDSAGQYL